MSCSHRKCVSFLFKQGFTNHTFVAGAKGREEAGATGTLGSACLTEGLACAKTLRQKETWLACSREAWRLFWAELCLPGIHAYRVDLP